MTSDDTFASRLIHARTSKAFSQLELAELSGIAAAQISRYESGKNIPRANVVSKLAKALSVPPNWLWSGKADRNKDFGFELTIELPAKLYERISELAESSDRSIQEEIIRRLEWAVPLVSQPISQPSIQNVSGDIPYSMAQDIAQLARVSNVSFDEMLARIFVAGIHPSAPQIIYLPVLPGATGSDVRATLEAATDFIRPDATVVSERISRWSAIFNGQGLLSSEVPTKEAERKLQNEVSELLHGTTERKTKRASKKSPQSKKS